MVVEDVVVVVVVAVVVESAQFFGRAYVVQ